MRLKTIVAGTALAVALALVAAPGFAGSRTPAPYEAIPAAAFQALETTANGGSAESIPTLDPVFGAAGPLDHSFSFVDQGSAATPPVLKRSTNQPEPTARSVIKPSKYVLHGQATFYDAGYTAMRLPRGTVIRVCAKGGCLERTITDYGPVAGTGRIIDMYRPDFFKICGCASGSGVIDVTVYVY